MPWDLLVPEVFLSSREIDGCQKTRWNAADQGDNWEGVIYEFESLAEIIQSLYTSTNFLLPPGILLTNFNE